MLRVKLGLCLSIVEALSNAKSQVGTSFEHCWDTISMLRVKLGLFNIVEAL